ncbi:MAG: FAD-dependent oxidoreductase [Microcoleus sp. PH2017_29_MFU_D_A]|uniref:FAD-dependent oxidoreductase n=1 Tax=unclassified Microcoleus TaxID=2642155 RepID=UPI001D61FE28|nr:MULTISPECIES: FAD-dependent oxidoreductase [unclassified Microcoleus]MCC3429130.1 FAD-dependent oxidoreductase [Microcoleus sp. PH2017_04_SCI_O_A]MCC3442357.1 FAD-dependent oxidoreductase [Microcoleus sp. PH2017_03_ELD_O_A]MCC3501469.1 FAD-dependent oxidoreductase [Microcoleus sp. PH2017_19_SFW_U_A]TAE16180.1 MAG: FAD-dependent oxidoreductase [Oscillatoriales cyanobacterium]MCC3415251.1 FAD-dependent oxidoreductase [Microcoleus sp. PH2017_02_FOX_O_A]
MSKLIPQSPIKLRRYLFSSLKGRSLVTFTLSLITSLSAITPALAALPRNPDKEETCDILVAGGGLAGAATAYEGLLAGRTVCITEITDWLGGQISSQGTSALDERDTQRSLLFYPRGYLELRQRIKEHYGRLNPGGCWVSYSCFMPYNGHKILSDILQDAAEKGKGKLKWFPNTVIKELAVTPASAGNAVGGQQIKSAIGIQHKPAANTPPINTETLSQTIEDAYRYENSARFNKTIIRFTSKPPNQSKSQPRGADWFVVDATETGELIGLADVPYRLGIDPRSPLEPSSASPNGDTYCTQGFTYTFAMEATKEPQQHQQPSFYQQYAPYYSYELARLASFPLVFSYRQIRSMRPDEPRPADPKQFPIYPGDISMQNWTWGNDYRPGSAEDNLIYSRSQLAANGQLQPGGWMGGLRAETLRRGEENAKGYFYWLVAGTTDSQLGNGVKKPYPNNRFLSGLDSPMGTVHGLSKYPYMREGRRIIGRPTFTQPQGFTVWEVDMSRNDFKTDFYRQNLSEQEYRNLWLALGGLNAPALAVGIQSVEETKSRSRATIYPDSVGIGHYAIDFHPCMTNSPPEAPGNTEREGTRKGQGSAYPFQIPLRAMIPQKIDNMLVAGKSIAVSHTAAAAYRVHSFEWSAGAAAGVTAAFSLEKGILPYELVDELPSREPNLEALQLRLQQNKNPIAFPGTSIFNSSWQNWK